MKEVGVGSRSINFLIDTIIISLIAYGMYKWWSFHVLYWDYKPHPYYVFFYPTIFVYYTIFESLTSRSPGKWLTMTKVRDVKGGKPALYQIVIRSLIRLIIVEMFFMPLFDRPLHDQLSKTRVVQV